VLQVVAALPHATLTRCQQHFFLHRVGRGRWQGGSICMLVHVRDILYAGDTLSYHWLRRWQGRTHNVNVPAYTGSSQGKQQRLPAAPG
jgi:hypothetical protein